MKLLQTALLNSNVTGSVQMFHLVLSARVIIAGELTSNRVDLEGFFEDIVYFTLSL